MTKSRGGTITVRADVEERALAPRADSPVPVGDCILDPVAAPAGEGRAASANGR